MTKTTAIENVWLRKEGKSELVLSVSVDGKDYVILRSAMPVDGELSHCIHAIGIDTIVSGKKPEK